MKKQRKKLLSFLLVFCMTLSLLPMASFAEGAGDVLEQSAAEAAVSGTVEVETNHSNAKPVVTGQPVQQEGENEPEEEKEEKEEGSAAEQYTVTYEANDPDGIIESARPLKLAYPAGTQVAVEPYAAEESGGVVSVWYNGKSYFTTKKDCDYVFQEWNTKADGTGKSYQQRAELTKEIRENITLYAIWVKRAYVTVNKTITMADGTALDKIDLPEEFWFSIQKGGAYAGGLCAQRVAGNAKWTDVLEYDNQGRLASGTTYTFQEDLNDAMTAIYGYELAKVEYYVDGSKTPIVWTLGDEMPEVPLTLSENTTVDVVNTYRKAGADIQWNGLSIQHRIAQSDSTGWESNDGQGHQATVRQPNVAYKVNLDLNAMQLTESGKFKWYGEQPDQLWQTIKGGGYGAFLDLYLSFDKTELAPLTVDDFKNVKLEHEWFELYENPYYPTVELVDPNATEGYEFVIHCAMNSEGKNATPSDTITLSGLSLTLQQPLTDSDTDKNPRIIQITGQVEGEFYGGVGPMAMDAEVRYQEMQPLQFTSAVVTDTAKVYWAKEALHEHDYDLEYDESTHWWACGCGDVKDKEAHRFGDWTVTKEATETETGEEERVCSVCTYTETQEIPKLDPEEPEDPENPDEPEKKESKKTAEKKAVTSTPKTGDNSNVPLWAALLCVSGVGVTGLCVYSNKRKEHDA